MKKLLTAVMMFAFASLVGCAATDMRQSGAQFDDGGIGDAYVKQQREIGDEG